MKKNLPGVWLMLAAAMVLWSFQASDTALLEGLDSLMADSVAMDSLQADSLRTDADSNAATVFYKPMDFYEAPILSTKGRQAPYPGGWFFVLNCFLLLILGIKLIVFPQYTKKSWNALVNEHLFFQLIREKSPLSFILLLMELILWLYVFSLVLLLVLRELVPSVGFDLLIIGKLFLMVSAFYLAKSILTYLLATLTDHVELYKVLKLSHIIVTSHMSWLLIPLILLVMYLSVPYRDYGVYVVLGCFGLGIIALIFRALRISLKVRAIFNLQFFLYLCAFEVMPYLFMAKVLEISILD